jgi:hypothetical protein
MDMHSIKLTLKILSLQCYDIILGIDWLEKNNPMEVNWEAKWMSFDYQGGKVLLQGITSNSVHCELISGKDLTTLDNQDKFWCDLELQAVQSNQAKSLLPTDIQAIVYESATLFLAPTSLPPKTAYVHTIPLIHGAQSFRLRLFIYFILLYMYRLLFIFLCAFLFVVIFSN